MTNSELFLLTTNYLEKLVLDLGFTLRLAQHLPLVFYSFLCIESVVIKIFWTFNQDITASSVTLDKYLVSSHYSVRIKQVLGCFIFLIQYHNSLSTITAY